MKLKVGDRVKVIKDRESQIVGETLVVILVDQLEASFIGYSNRFERRFYFLFESFYLGDLELVTPHRIQEIS